jgi:hypothetical protein
MAKVDLRREHKQLYAPPREPVIVDVPELSFLMVDGHGDPNTSPEYAQAIEALYTISYTLKFTLKGEPGGMDYAVMPLEGLWWAQDMSTFTAGEKSAWDWTAMIAQPDIVDGERLAAAIERASAKKELPAAALARLERFGEGEAAQVLHIGPYSEEGPTIAGLHEFIAAGGYELRGKHHEIYLSDPRRAAPERLKTVIRQPISAAS